jgi:hypothetical protein
MDETTATLQVESAPPRPQPTNNRLVEKIDPTLVKKSAHQSSKHFFYHL